MSATETADPGAGLLTWWLDVGVRADCMIALRDYMLRLGFVVTQEGPSRLRVGAEVEAEELGAYVASWGTTNGIAVHVAAARPDQPTPATLARV